MPSKRSVKPVWLPTPSRIAAAPAPTTPASVFLPGLFGVGALIGSVIFRPSLFDDSGNCRTDEQEHCDSGCVLFGNQSADFGGHCAPKIQQAIGPEREEPHYGGSKNAEPYRPKAISLL